MFNICVCVCVCVCACVCVCGQQARDVRNNEVVAIKKMSYSGKQTNEVTNHKDTTHFLFVF